MYIIVVGIVLYKDIYVALEGFVGVRVHAELIDMWMRHGACFRPPATHSSRPHQRLHPGRMTEKHHKEYAACPAPRLTRGTMEEIMAALAFARPHCTIHGRDGIPSGHEA